MHLAELDSGSLAAAKRDASYIASPSRVEQISIICAALLTATWFAISPLNFVLSNILGYAYTPTTTATLLTVFPAAALCFLIRVTPITMRVRKPVAVATLLLIALASLWLFNFLSEQITQISGPVLSGMITQFDNKRPYFFGLGFCAAGLIGILAARWPSRFVPAFLKAMYGFAILVAGLYAFMDRGDIENARLGGDAGLAIGIFLSQGLIAGIALILLAGRIRWTAAVFSLVIVVGIMLSGTRAALVAVAVACLVVALLRFKVALRYGVFAVPALLGAVVMAYSMGWIPEQTVERLMRFELEGSESRVMLLMAGWESFTLNPFGKVLAYDAVFPAGIEYAHNTLLQFVMECGVLALLPLLVLGILAFVTAWRVRSWPLGAALLVYGAGVATHSLSSGDAYVAQVWFFVFFFATLRWVRDRRCPAEISFSWWDIFWPNPSKYHKTHAVHINIDH